MSWLEARNRSSSSASLPQGFSQFREAFEHLIERPSGFSVNLPVWTAQLAFRVLGGTQEPKGKLEGIQSPLEPLQLFASLPSVPAQVLSAIPVFFRFLPGPVFIQDPLRYSSSVWHPAGWRVMRAALMCCPANVYDANCRGCAGRRAWRGCRRRSNRRWWRRRRLVQRQFGRNEGFVKYIRASSRSGMRRTARPIPGPSS